MNPSSLPPVTRRPARHLWLWALLVVPSLLLVTLAAGVVSCFRLGSEARVLRNGLIESSGVEWRQQIALNANCLTLGAVRAGLSCVRLDPGARAALQSVRSLGVGVYQVVSGTPPDRAAMLAAADSAMTARGWQRVVGVMDGRDLVAIYLPDKNISVHRLKCCVMVFDREEMVLVSARATWDRFSLTRSIIRTYAPRPGGWPNVERRNHAGNRRRVRTRIPRRVRWKFK